jgi:ABC-type Fe3+ transport system permease subunit
MEAVSSMSEQNSQQDELDALRSWGKSIKLGMLALLLFVLACLVYGWFNVFSFWHAYADAGLNSSIAHAIYYGVFAGPVIVVVVTLLARFVKKK